MTLNKLTATTVDTASRAMDNSKAVENEIKSSRKTNEKLFSEIQESTGKLKNASKTMEGN